MFHIVMKNIKVTRERRIVQRIFYVSRQVPVNDFIVYLSSRMVISFICISFMSNESVTTTARDQINTSAILKVGPKQPSKYRAPKNICIVFFRFIILNSFILLICLVWFQRLPKQVNKYTQSINSTFFSYRPQLFSTDIQLTLVHK